MVKVSSKEHVALSVQRRERFKEFIDQSSEEIKVTSYTGPVKNPWEEVSFISAQLTKPPIDPHKEHVDLTLEFGGRYSPPITVDLPVMVAGMSYGAISTNAKLAVHRALNVLAREHGIKVFYNTGEGGVLEHELDDRSYLLMMQVASGRFNVNLESLLKADAIEIKIGQGAKPGMGGQLPGHKVTKEIAERRRIPEGIPAYSPARNMDIIGPEDLFAKIQELRVATDGKIPIGVKIAATDVYHDAIIASRMADFITVDGMSAGTGAAPEIAQAHMGIPTMPAIVEARKGIDDMASLLYRHLRKIDRTVDYEEITLISSGGIIFPNEIYTALSLGSDMVAIGTGIELALGCLACFNCHVSCPKNIAGSKVSKTKESKPELLDIGEASENIVRYFLRAKKSLELIYAANGHYIGNSSTPLELRTTSCSINRTTGIPMPGKNVAEDISIYTQNEHGGCGIAAIIPSQEKLGEILNGGTPLQVNKLLAEMLEAQQVRGPDSAGFAFYYFRGIPKNTFRIKVRSHSSNLDAIQEIVERYSGGNKAITKNTPARYERGFEIYEFTINSSMNNSLSALDELSSIRELALISFGNYSDVIKDVGTVKRVSELYNIMDYRDILYGIGHVRTATMSSVNPVTAHPFCTSVLPDITVVHNGEVTNAPKLKRKLRVMGYPFFAPTDSEIIAAYIAERLVHNYSMIEACTEFVKKADGPYTFLLATPQGVAFVKDRYALRPAMSGYNPKEKFYAVATDITALSRVGACEEIDLLSTGGVKIFPVNIQ